MVPRKRGRPQKTEYLTTTQAAAWLTERGCKIGARTVARRCDDGTISCTRIVGEMRSERRILITELEDYLTKAMDTG